MNNTKREVAERLKDFFSRNRNYAVEVDLKHSQTHEIIGIFSITMNRECLFKDNLLSISWKNNECISDTFPFSLTAAPQWYIDIVSKPCSKRNMPASPKFGDVA